MIQSDSIKLLIVDDNEANRYALSRILRKRGVCVSEAGSGKEALQIASQSPDLMLIDIHLPDMTAYELLQRLRSQPETAHLPAILMSAVEPAPQARTTAQTLGVHSFLTLPVLPDDLWIVIRATLQRRDHTS